MLFTHQKPDQHKRHITASQPQHTDQLINQQTFLPEPLTLLEL